MTLLLNVLEKMVREGGEAKVNGRDSANFGQQIYFWEKWNQDTSLALIHV